MESNNSLQHTLGVVKNVAVPEKCFSCQIFITCLYMYSCVYRSANRWFLLVIAVSYFHVAGEKVQLYCCVIVSFEMQFVFAST